MLDRETWRSFITLAQNQSAQDFVADNQLGLKELKMLQIFIFTVIMMCLFLLTTESATITIHVKLGDEVKLEIVMPGEKLHIDKIQPNMPLNIAEYISYEDSKFVFQTSNFNSDMAGVYSLEFHENQTLNTKGIYIQLVENMKCGLKYEEGPSSEWFLPKPPHSIKASFCSKTFSVAPMIGARVEKRDDSAPHNNNPMTTQKDQLDMESATVTIHVKLGGEVKLEIVVPGEYADINEIPLRAPLKIAKYVSYEDSKFVFQTSNFTLMMAGNYSLEFPKKQTLNTEERKIYIKLVENMKCGFKYEEGQSSKWFLSKPPHSIKASFCSKTFSVAPTIGARVEKRDDSTPHNNNPMTTKKDQLDMGWKTHKEIILIVIFSTVLLALLFFLSSLVHFDSFWKKFRKVENESEEENMIKFPFP